MTMPTHLKLTGDAEEPTALVTKPADPSRVLAFAAECAGRGVAVSITAERVAWRRCRA